MSKMAIDTVVLECGPTNLAEKHDLVQFHWICRIPEKPAVSFNFTELGAESMRYQCSSWNNNHEPRRSQIKRDDHFN